MSWRSRGSRRKTHTLTRYCYSATELDPTCQNKGSSKSNPDACFTHLNRYFLLSLFTESTGIRAVNLGFLLSITVRDVTHRPPPPNLCTRDGYRDFGAVSYDATEFSPSFRREMNRTPGRSPPFQSPSDSAYGCSTSRTGVEAFPALQEEHPCHCVFAAARCYGHAPWPVIAPATLTRRGIPLRRLSYINRYCLVRCFRLDGHQYRHEKHINSYFRDFFALFRIFLFAQALFDETPNRRYGKPCRTHWSRSGRDPCSVERVASAQSFFSAGVDKSIFLVSVREASFVRTLAFFFQFSFIVYQYIRPPFAYDLFIRTRYYRTTYLDHNP